MKPKAFVMSEPVAHILNHWIVMIAIDYAYFDFIRAMPCVLSTEAWIGREIRVYIDPRYDYEEAWLWIYEQLETETREVELGEVWDAE